MELDIASLMIREMRNLINNNQLLAAEEHERDNDKDIRILIGLDDAKKGKDTLIVYNKQKAYYYKKKSRRDKPEKYEYTYKTHELSCNESIIQDAEKDFLKLLKEFQRNNKKVKVYNGTWNN